MIVLNLYRFFCGYVHFKITGDFPERLMNQLSAQRISMWDVVRRKDEIELSISARNYRRIRQIRGKNRTRTKIIEKLGFPFFARKRLGRIGLLAGALFFVSFLYFMSGFVWDIEVSGNKTIDTQRIVSALEEAGLKKGMRKKGLDTSQLRVDLALKIDEISWAAVNINGVKATVEIREAKSPDERNRENQPCNLLASFDGVVKDIRVKNGVTRVNKGDAVVKGDLLVSGIVEYKDGTTAFKHSEGEIVAQTKRELHYFVDFEQTVEQRTGKTAVRRVLNFFGFKIPLFLGNAGEDSQKKIKEHTFTYNNMQLPITLIEAKYYFKKSKMIVYDEKEATKLAKAGIKRLEEVELKNKRIISKKEAVTKKQDGVGLRAEYICEENIAMEEILLFSTVK